MAEDQIIALGDTEEDDVYNNLAGTIKAKLESWSKEKIKHGSFNS